MNNLLILFFENKVKSKKCGSYEKICLEKRKCGQPVETE